MAVDAGSTPGIREDGRHRLAEIEENLKEQNEYIPGRGATSLNKDEPTKSVWQGWYDVDCWLEENR